MKYENVIPNLECAKLCTYYYNRHEITSLATKLDPGLYTKFFIRKEYDDGIYPKELFYFNCEYGGRAFNPSKYSPLPAPIENTIPNMSLYKDYIYKFGKKPQEKALIKRILNCAHIRLSLDGKTSIPMDQIKRILDTGRYTGIIFHDYDISKIDNAFETIYNISQLRNFITKDGINPFPIGNKFPIQIYSSEDLERWLRLTAMPSTFFLQYNGVMENKTLYHLCEDNKRIAKQIFYKVDGGCSSEEEFFYNELPKIFIQVLFLRRTGMKILLNYDEEKIKTPEISNFLKLLNCWLSFSWYENFMPHTQSLYRFCRRDAKFHYRSWAYLRFVKVRTEDIRNSFQYIREKNYKLFSKFYELDSIIYKEGEFVDEWGRNQIIN